MSTNIPPLAPSEIVMLRGADFVPATKYGEVVLGGGATVAGGAWMRATWLTALAAVVASGEVRLTPTTSKHLFGLFSTHGLRAERAADGAPWPNASLEQRMVDRLAKGPAEVRALFHALLEQDMDDPEPWGLSLAKRGLIARGLLEVHERKTLKFFTTRDVVVPPATVSLAAAIPVEPVQTLLRDGGGADAASWKEVRAALDAAIVQRTSRDTDSVDTGPD